METRTLQSAKIAADKARQIYDNESAIQHYGQALALMRQNAELADPQVEYDLLAGREECYNLVGNRLAQQADLDDMVRIAQAIHDVARQIEAFTRQVALANVLGNHADAQRAAEAALALAQQVGDRKLEADSLTALGEASYRLGDQARTLACHEQALSLYRQLGDLAGEANSLRLLGRVAHRTGQSAQVSEYYEQALALYRALHDRAGEASVLNALGVIESDRALARTYYEQSLAIVQAIGDRSGQGRAYNNLALIYWSLGLYARARDYLEQAVQIEREMQGRSNLAYYLESLSRVYLELGEYSQARQMLEEGQTLASNIGDRWVESGYWLGLGRVALAQDRFVEAREAIQHACDMQRSLGTWGDLAASLAYLGMTYLALDDWEAAHRCTSEAITHMETAGNAGDYMAQDVWWMHYQVLRAVPGRADDETLDEQSWTCLQRARDAMLSAITTLSDEGLRRNYLNKVKTNHDIITEWTGQSARRAGGQAQTEVLTLPVATQDAAAEAEQLKNRLKRLLDISVQMNEIHDAGPLRDYVMDQVIELSGAERGFLALVDKTGQMDFKVTRGMAQDEMERAGTQIGHVVLGTKSPVLLQDALADERFGVLELNLRSVLCVPMLSRSEPIGMIYADNRSVSGRFSQADVDLLTIFANQAATALENARLYEETVAWARTLERRVAERTAELQQANAALSRRAMQLETSNEVGQQVTLILDPDELLKQVVSLIQTRFGYYFVSAWQLSDKKDCVVLRAGAGRVAAGEWRALGFSIPMGTLNPNPIAEVCATGVDCLIEDLCKVAPDLAPDVLPDTCAELVLPLRIGEKIIGALDIQSDQPGSFEPGDRLVLQTLANQIAISVRNAQLYMAEQHRRRLAESLEQTGRELASSLDLSEVPGRILVQLAAVVPYERCSVILERGSVMQIVAQCGFPEDDRTGDLRIIIREGDVFQQMIRTHSPVLVEDVTQVPGWQLVDWLPVNKSWLGVPLISKDHVIGMISMTRREAGAFSPDDALLVSAFAGQAAISLENARLYGELSKAYQTLERLDKTKTDFINVAAHELRTPLTVIRGYTQVLGTLPTVKSDPQANPLLEGIVAGTSRMHEIVNSVLDVTKIDSQTLHVHKARVMLADVIQRVSDEFEPALQERRLTLTLGDLAPLPLIEADPDLLFKLFYQLVVNAIKYTPDGGSITVTGRVVEREEESAERDMLHSPPAAVEIIVSDTGIGIDPAHHELIFEKFYQTGEVAVHSSGRTKFKGGGPGLGLAIVRGIVLAHGGNIWVESEGYDEARCPGSHFHVCLPI